MTDLQRTIRLGLCLLALPLVATISASAHSWGDGDQPFSVLQPVSGTTLSPDPVDWLADGSHVVQLDGNGFLNGRVVALEGNHQVTGLENLKVALLRQGKLEKVVFTEQDGSFRVSGLTVGTYSLIASNQDAFAAHGFRVVRTNGSPALVTSAISPRVARIHEIVMGAVSSAGSPSPQRLNPETRSHTIGGTTVRLIDHGLSGQISSSAVSALEEAEVYLFQGRTQIAKAEVDFAGSFRFEDLLPGNYDLVAAGPGGYSAFRLTAVADSPSPIRPVSFIPGSPRRLSQRAAARVSILLNYPSRQGLEPQVPATASSTPQRLGDQAAFPTAIDNLPTPGYPEQLAAGGGGGGRWITGKLVGEASFILGIIALADGDSEPGDSSPFN